MRTFLMHAKLSLLEDLIECMVVILKEINLSTLSFLLVITHLKLILLSS